MGDKIWTGHAIWSGEMIDCPVCLGTTQLLVKPVTVPDSEGSIIECGYCKRQTNLPAGKVIEQWIWKPVTRCIQVERVLTTTSMSEADTYEYQTNVTRSSRQSLRPEIGLYQSEEEAQAAAEKQVLLCNKKSEKEKIASIYRARAEGKGWTIGYSRREIRELKAKIQYHQKAIGIKQKSP